MLRLAAVAVEEGLIFSILLILVSVFYYNPKIMVERRPGIIDWFEGLVYTGLLFVAAAFLLLEVLGLTLSQVRAVFSRHLPAPRPPLCRACGRRRRR